MKRAIAHLQRAIKQLLFWSFFLKEQMSKQSLYRSFEKSRNEQ